ncbi:MAG: COX15/CtaA family protein [Saprospiraceae bacterium]|nr:COX15/CtaA family protein [Saprospiraceae bacterium]MDW8483533.1 COX15/CtaA family protein [Saprospiraceae bacterium]
MPSVQKDNPRVARAIRLWLWVGVVMLFLQVVIGGVTRLTGSGLSITRWEVITGTLPPLSEQAWKKAFDLYKATPQYAKINRGMSLSEFKFIYFWEYFHRLWARLMFLAFVVPFGIFLWRSLLPKYLLKHLLAVISLAALEGFFGWIMVASGLIHRPWVNAYNLLLHLCMALVIFSYLLWITLSTYEVKPDPGYRKRWISISYALLGVLFLQIALGALMSGTRAGLFFPSWPDMNGTYWPTILADVSYWNWDSFVHYDSNPFMPALIQFLHRNVGYLLFLVGLYAAALLWKQASTPPLRWASLALGGVLCGQVLLGILTLIHFRGGVPVLLGVLHQMGAVLLLGIVIFVVYVVMKSRRLVSLA